MRFSMRLISGCITFPLPIRYPAGALTGETKAAILALSEVVRTVWKNEKFGGNSRRPKGAPAPSRFVGQTSRLSVFSHRCLPWQYGPIQVSEIAVCRDSGHNFRLATIRHKPFLFRSTIRWLPNASW
jgi:hypothetical protein